MKAILRAVGLAATLMLSSVTHASQVYNFTYTFTSGTVVSGRFSGDANGDLITHLTNISASVNGTAMNGSGSLYASSYNYDETWSSGTGVASFSGTNNNLMFIDSDFPNNQQFTNYFQSESAADFAYVYVQTGNFTDKDSSTNAHWSVSAAVPEPTTYLMLLSGLVLVGCMARTRNPS